MRTSSEEPPSLTVPVELTLDDVVRTHVWTLLQLPGTRLLLGVSVLLSLGLVLLLLRALLRGDDVAAPLAGIVAVFAIAAVVASRVRRRARQHFESLSDSERTGSYTLTPDGFSWTVGRSSGRLPWTAVMRYEDTGDYLFLLTPGARTHVVPKRLLSENQRRELETYVDSMTGD